MPTEFRDSSLMWRQKKNLELSDQARSFQWLIHRSKDSMHKDTKLMCVKRDLEMRKRTNSILHGHTWPEIQGSWEPAIFMDLPFLYDTVKQAAYRGGRT